MFITKKHLSRRTFLMGTFGATVALPFLDAMVPALTAQARTAANRPLRFAAMYIPNGIFPEYWHPDTTGSDFELKRVMQPLTGLKDYITTVSKMTAPQGSVHLGASAAFLNGTGPVGKGGDFTALVSKKTIDQHIADMSPATRRCVRLKSAPKTWARPPAHATVSRAHSSTPSHGATTPARCQWASTPASPSNACSVRSARRSSAIATSRRSRACSTPFSRKRTN